MGNLSEGGGWQEDMSGAEKPLKITRLTVCTIPHTFKHRCTPAHRDAHKTHIHSHMQVHSNTAHWTQRLMHLYLWHIWWSQEIQNKLLVCFRARTNYVHIQIEGWIFYNTTIVWCLFLSYELYNNVLPVKPRTSKHTYCTKAHFERCFSHCGGGA